MKAWPLVMTTDEIKAELDACAIPTPEQAEQMETGFGAILTPLMALELGMKTAIGNVKRAMGLLPAKEPDIAQNQG